MFLPPNLKGICTAVILLMCVLSSPVHAAERITEDAVKAFYQKMAQTLINGSGDWDKAVAEMDKDLHEDFKATMRVTMDMPGRGEVTTVMPYNKWLYLEGIKANKVIDARYKKLENVVESVVISEDGRTAYVKDKSYTVMSTKVVGGERTTSVYTAECKDTVVLGEGDRLLTLEVDCDVMIEIPKDL